MLNAFRHHRVLRWPISSAGWKHVESTVLNAFRHHRVLRSGTPSSVCGSWVLNAFRHHRVLRQDQVGLGHAALGSTWVLNAFRHHRVLRNPTIHFGRPKFPCAQRLSASQGATPASAASWVLGLGDGVLNAFRHHRVLTGAKSKAEAVPQRLSASQGAKPKGAQRLSASQGATPGRVLNEVESVEPGPKCSTPFGITGCYATERRKWMLNAFGITGCSTNRLQRLSASQATPGREVESQGVLNAFRHHRVLRRSRGSSSTSPSQGATQCSTPFGITGCYAPLAGV